MRPGARCATAPAAQAAGRDSQSAPRSTEAIHDIRCVLKELEMMQFKPTKNGRDLKASVRAALSDMAKTEELRIVQKFAGLQPQAYEFAQNESDSAVT